VESIVKVITISLVMAAVGAALGFNITGGASDGAFVMLFLGSVGAVVGSVAGAAHEISLAVRQKPRDE